MRSPQQRCGAKPALLRGQDPSTGGLGLAALAGAQPEHKQGGLGRGRAPEVGRSGQHSAAPGTVPAKVLPTPCRRTHGVARAETRAEAAWHPTVPITSCPWCHHPASQPVGTLGCSRAGPLVPGAGWSPPGKGPAGTEGHPPAWARAPRLQHLAPPMGNAPPPASLSKEVEAAACQGREPAGHSLSRHQPRPCPSPYMHLAPTATTPRAAPGRQQLCSFVPVQSL